MATIKPILKSITKTQKYIQSLFNQTQSLNKALLHVSQESSYTHTILKKYDNWNKLFIGQLKQIFDQYNIKDIIGKVDEDNAWLLSLGWPPLMHAPANSASRLHKHCAKIEPILIQKEVDESILGFYNANLIRNEILKCWEAKQFLNNRIHILRSAIEAHINSNYTLSIPALLPQLEGIIAENFKHKGFLNGETYHKYLKQIIPEERTGFNRLFRRIIFEYILKNFVHGQPIVFDLNRHAILHGADVNYSQPTTSLKAILIIDFVINQIRFVSLDHSNMYHRCGCYIAIKSQKPRKIYSSEYDARDDGKKPCKRCCRHKYND